MSTNYSKIKRKSSFIPYKSLEMTLAREAMVPLSINCLIPCWDPANIFRTSNASLTMFSNSSLLLSMIGKNPIYCNLNLLHMYYILIKIQCINLGSTAYLCFVTIISFRGLRIRYREVLSTCEYQKNYFKKDLTQYT